MKNLIIIIETLLIFYSSSFAQVESEDIEIIRKDLSKITKDIEILEKKIETEQRKEKQTERSINNLGKEIYLRQIKINKLYKAERQRQKSINIIKNEISEFKKEIKYLRNLLKKRIVHLYKYGRSNEIEAILEAVFKSSSFTDVMIRLKYFILFVDRDKKNIQKIKENIEELNNKNNILLKELDNQKIIISKVRKEKNLLTGKRKNLKKRKENIKNSKKTYLVELRKKEDSQRRLLNLFTNLGKIQPEVPMLPLTKGADFASLKRKMMWPVRGTILSHYGRDYNKELKTWKNNYGIDIKAPIGNNVYCVGYGRVFDVMWLPGYGTILIIEHDNGYVTSYAHLLEIVVDLKQIVAEGQVIAKVGEDGSFEGPKLNFQLWRRGTSLNPELWLSKGRISALIP